MNKIRHNAVRCGQCVGLCGAMMIVSSLVATAGDLYWDGSDTSANADGGAGTWDASQQNWDSAAQAGTPQTWQSANVARFVGVGGVVNLASALSAQRLVFDADAYQLQGGTLQLTVGLNSSGNESFYVKSGAKATISTDVTANVGEVWLRGGGTLVLQGNNQFNGSLVLQGGSTLEFANVAAIASTNGSRMGFSGAGNTIRYTGTTSELTRLADSWGLSSGVNTIDVSQVDTVLTLRQNLTNNSGVSGVAKAGLGTLLLAGNTSFTGGLSVLNGSVQVLGNIGTQAVTLGNGSTSGKLILGDASTVKSLTVSNLTSSGTGTSNAVVGSGSAIQTLTVQTSTYGNFLGRLGGDATGENQLKLIKSGLGNLTLSGNGTLVGGVEVQAGLLGIRYGTELGSPTSPMPNQVILNGGTLANLTDATGVDSYGSGWSPTVPKNVGIYIGSQGATIRVGYGSTRVMTVEGDFSGPGVLSKIDTGTLVLSGRCKTTGNVMVNKGTMMLTDTSVVDFSITDTGTRMLGGTGSVLIKGAFAIDTANVTLSEGSWTLVDATNLVESYGSGFRMLGSGWKKDVTMWYRRDGNRMWSFSQATSVLKVEPVGSYPSWVCDFDYPSDNVDISITGDPDGDGVMNGVEHIFGTAPNDGKGGGDRVTSSNGEMHWDQPRNPNPSSEVTSHYQWSTDMVEWKDSGIANAAGEIADIEERPVVNGRASVVAKLRAGGKRLFMRMGVDSTSTQPLPRGWYFSKKEYIPEELPVYATIQNQLPSPDWSAHPEYQSMYWKCWQLAFSHLRKPTVSSPMVSNWLDEAFSNNIFQWDTCFMMMFARYGHYQFPAIQSLDNFYALQRGSGYICREYTEADGAEFHWADEGGNLPSGWKNTINPPIFGWAETETYKVTGDKTRFASVLPVLEKYVSWLNRYGDPADVDMDKSGRRSIGTPHDLYWNTGLGCGMDNTPKPTGTGAGWVDMSCQMVMQYNDLATIYRELGMTDKALAAENEARNIAGRINRWCWDETDGFYYDVDAQGVKFKKKTASGFWPLIAGVASSAQAARLVDHLKNPNEFWRPNVFPTLSADEPEYRADGGYWLGGVWAPTNYMIIKGLERYGYDDFAAEASERYLAAMATVYQNTGTVWENYAPETMVRGNPSKGDFVGWSGCGPIALYIENILGFRPHGADQSLNWYLRIHEAHGISKLRFGSVVSDLWYNGNGEVRVIANQAYDLTIHGVTYHILAGENVIQCWPK